jgi:uncharacterized repeat protein (TIGR01451 family)
MNSYRFLAVATFWLAVLPASVLALGRPAPLPEFGPTPLLYVLFNGPPGMRVTFYQGMSPPREYRVPVVLGLRPGYIYHPRLSGFPERPGMTLFPTLEVRGTLLGGATLFPSHYPAPVYFSDRDVDLLLGGSLLTKVVYLEDPKKAFAEAGRVDRPFEVELPPNVDLLNESRCYGRPVLVVRAGDRETSEAELRKQSVPGTVLFPDEKCLGLPQGPPHLPWACFQWYDPIIGPRPPIEECLRDGGDTCEPVCFDQDGRLQGLDPEDTVAEYRDCTGRKRIAISNRCCVCVPRYAVLRSELRLELTQVAQGPIDRVCVKPPLQIEGERLPLRYDQYKQVVERIGSLRPSVVEGVEAVSVVGRVEGVRVVETVLLTRDVTGICKEQPCPVEKPLALCKSSDRKAAQLGDIISYSIQYTNQGGKPISDVVVSDSLTGRLEYVPGSARSSRSAVFSTQPNEAGSLVLRWQVAGALLPGDSGVVTFQARVR